MQQQIFIFHSIIGILFFKFVTSDKTFFFSFLIIIILSYISILNPLNIELFYTCMNDFG